MTEARTLTGACLCRAVRYEVADAFEYAMNCHCSDCRRATGSAFKPFAGIGAERIAIIYGHDDVLIYGGTNHDVHCRRCGSLLYSIVRDGKTAHVAMGTLIEAPSIRPERHIFVGSKAPWFTINDDLPQHDRLPGD